MLILGRKYKFTELEKERLTKKKHTLNTITYTDRDPNDILQDIENVVSSENILTIVLNTKSKVDNTIVKYMTSLQFDTKITIITIEHFLEKYLHKCYIPEDNDDLHFLDDIEEFSIYKV